MRIKAKDMYAANVKRGQLNIKAYAFGVEKRNRNIEKSRGGIVMSDAVIITLIICATIILCAYFGNDNDDKNNKR